MKKLLCVVFSLVLILSLFSLAGCGEKKSESLKLGLGIYSYIEKIQNADGDTDGQASSTTAIAAVLLDEEGKIVDCAIDVAAAKLGFTSEGKFVEAGELKTKYELGNDYAMKSASPIGKEWFEQADAFISVVKGKTIDEVKALQADDKKGTEEVTKAGCTIKIADFILALEKAVKNAADSKATADDTLKLGVSSSQSEKKDASEEAAGSNVVSTTVAAAAIDKSGKVTDITIDAVQVKLAFDVKGVSDTEYNVPISTKKELGKDYGMSAYGKDLNGDGTVKEWFEQAAAFEDECIGKNADEISGLAADNGYGVEALQTAGCTINVSELVKAAVKAAK